ncbi:MAG: class I SAM-dependent methyltransferase [Burkholderiales bacterium]
MAYKEFKLDFEALISQLLNGKGYLHYGYWENAVADEMNLCRLGAAQQAYFDQLAASIPGGTRSILDVGSGTGSNARGLIEKGYAVDCVCPSAKLNEIARRKLPDTTRIFESRFEELALPGEYDLMIFSESFHYLDARAAIRKVCEQARRNMIVFDYFPRAPSADGVRVSHAQFLALVNGEFADRLRIESDRDVTAEILPTFRVLDEFRDQYAQPFVTRMIGEFRTRRPILSFLLSWPLNRLAAKVRRKSDRAKKFLDTYEYRLIRLARV